MGYWLHIEISPLWWLVFWVRFCLWNFCGCVSQISLNCFAQVWCYKCHALLEKMIVSAVLLVLHLESNLWNSHQRPYSCSADHAQIFLRDNQLPCWLTWPTVWLTNRITTTGIISPFYVIRLNDEASGMLVLDMAHKLKRLVTHSGNNVHFCLVCVVWWRNMIIDQITTTKYCSNHHSFMNFLCQNLWRSIDIWVILLHFSNIDS